MTLINEQDIAHTLEANSWKAAYLDGVAKGVDNPEAYADEAVELAEKFLADS